MNGKEAVELASQNCYDLILMDLKMPIMDGFVATQKIKQQSPNLPIIAQTAYARSEDKERALESGCDDFISKPFNKADLLIIIDKLMISK
jgi:two-component system sensor histidine kinase EvgS